MKPLFDFDGNGKMDELEFLLATGALDPSLGQTASDDFDDDLDDDFDDDLDDGFDDGFDNDVDDGFDSFDGDDDF